MRWRDRTISRRTLLGITVATLGALPWLYPRGAPARTKLPKKAAGYQSEPNGDQNCGNCRYFLADQGACELVEGDISPSAWCRMWSGA